jgi:CheY-like chemotaxis protein
MGRACTSVLIVDHDPVSRDFAARVAENDGYVATEAAHAGEAFAALEARGDVRVVVANNQWSNGIDGIALAGTLRSFWPGVAIVLTADRVLPSDADLPPDAVVLAKPYTPGQLIDSLDAALEAHGSGEEPADGG